MKTTIKNTILNIIQTVCRQTPNGQGFANLKVAS